MSKLNDLEERIAILEKGQGKNLLDYGVLGGDYETDDTAVVQAALDDLDHGDCLIIPKGGFVITSELTCWKHALKFSGMGGISSQEGDPKGSSLLAATNDMTLFKFQQDGGFMNEGPIFENINFADVTSAGRTATLLEIHNAQRWTLRNVTLRDANVGLMLAGPDDNAWGGMDQCVVNNNDLGINVVFSAGFTMNGGSFIQNSVGLDLRNCSHARLLGIKIDDGEGVILGGRHHHLLGCSFEMCDPGVRIVHYPNEPEDYLSGGLLNQLICDFSGNGTQTGIVIEPGARNNTIMAVGTWMGQLIDDQGENTLILAPKYRR